MEAKKITYIAFKDYDEINNIQEGFVFFNDGSFIKVSKQELIKALMSYAKQENISQIDDLLYNNEHIIHITDQNEEDLCKELKENSIINSLGEKIEQETEKALNKEESIENENVIEDDLDLDDNSIEDKSLLNNFLKKSKKYKIIVTSLVISAAMAIGTVSYNLLKKGKEKHKDNEGVTDTINNQKKFDNMSYEELLKITQNSSQRLEMTKIGEFLDTFNGKFADNHIEQDKNIKAALSWDEVIALDIAYNDYTNEKVQNIFNGSTVDSRQLSEAYKSAILELTSAFVIENNNQSISIDNILNDNKGKVFYNKYHELFFKAKQTKGQEQLNYINQFYNELAKDFPINDQLQEVGMQHDNSMNDIESYKLSVVPMVAAAEILFQNLDIDHTLSDKAINYFNALGLCNYVNDKYSQYETITLTGIPNEYNPYYDTFKSKKIEELNNKNQYNINDAERDLSQLTAFKNIINNHSLKESIDQETTSYSQSNSYKTDSNKTTTSNRDEAVQAVGEDSVKEAEQKVNEDINSQNERAKQEADRQAEEERERLQQQEEEKKNQLEQDADKENNNLQDKIDNMNENLDKDQNVDESDFGKTEDGNNIVDIDDDHSDENGNIDDSVKDITTDPSGNSITPLPTPSDEGAENGYPGQSDQNIIEEEETISNEELANLIVEAMANAQQEETSKIYTK